MKLYKMALILKDIMTKKIENSTLDEIQLKKVFNFTMYPEDSKITTNKRIIKSDEGSMGGLIGYFFTSKIINHSTSLRLMAFPINFY